MIWDCFTFRNEFECLEIRLHELAPYVDRFVLVEADWTFQGNTKPLFFEERLDEFKDYPIMHVRMADTGVPVASDPWMRESLQRNSILFGLESAENTDIALMGDVDEIPRGDKIHDAVALLAKGNLQVSFEQALSFYHVNNVCYTTKWHGTQATTVGELKARLPQDVRDRRNASVPIRDGGWHWCNLGDPDWLIEKIESFSHDEVNLPQYKDPEFLAKCIEQGKEMTGRSDILFRRMELGEIELPSHLMANRDRFAHLFAPEANVAAEPILEAPHK